MSAFHPKRTPAAHNSSASESSSASSNFDAEIPDCALQLGVPEQKLAGAQVARFLVKQRNLRPPEAVRAVCCWVQANASCSPVLSTSRHTDAWSDERHGFSSGWGKASR